MPNKEYSNSTNKLSLDECYKCMENITELLVSYKHKKQQIDLFLSYNK